jgi:hypothetical protein
LRRGVQQPVRPVSEVLPRRWSWELVGRDAPGTVDAERVLPVRYVAQQALGCRGIFEQR